MLRRSRMLNVPLWLLLLGLVATVPSFAGSAVVGSVAGSSNATVGGQALLPNAVIFSGDSLQVKDGVAVVAVGKTGRMVLGRETVASFLRDAEDVTILLSQGNVSLFHPDDSVGMRVKAGDISVLPSKGFKTLGEVAMLDGSLIVTAKDGSLRVEGYGQTVNVAKGQTIKVATHAQRAPQKGAAGAGPHMTSSSALQWSSLGAGVASSVLSGVALSRAGDAKTAAQAATTAANSASTAASSAASAATSAENTANASGCALNIVANSLDLPSPFTPASGSCP